MLSDAGGDEARQPREQDTTLTASKQISNEVNTKTSRLSLNPLDIVDAVSTVPSSATSASPVRTNSTPGSGSPDPMSFLSLAEHTFTPLSFSEEFHKDAARIEGNTDDAFAPAVVTKSSASSLDDATPLAEKEPTYERTEQNSSKSTKNNVNKNTFGSEGNSTFQVEMGDKQIPASSIEVRANPQEESASLVKPHSGKEQAHEPTPPSPSNIATVNTTLATFPLTQEKSSFGHANASAFVLKQSPPLRIASVQPDTVVAHPKPIIRSNSTIKSSAIQHPSPDTDPRSRSVLDNIAQLEATAEKLSETSSIDIAIRDLHGELKRSDSRRSSLLAARTGTPAADDAEELATSFTQLKRHLSNASSIISINNAARQGGYSPAGFVRSPSQSYPSRFRASSRGQSDAPDIEVEAGHLSRHGPGKASVRSVRSTKMSLSEISESEPITLDVNAFEKADAAPPIDFDEHDIESTLLAAGPAKDAEIPSTDAFHYMLDDGLADHEELDLDLRFDHPPILMPHPAAEPELHRQLSVRSNNTFEEAQDAFIDFDGVHWEPNEEDYYEPPDHEPNLPTPRPLPKNDRPQSYFDLNTGQQMLYYPARVPAMLNLPPKLSSKPSSDVRNMRRSHVLDAMLGMNEQAVKAKHQDSVRKRQSVIPEFSFMKENRQSQMDVEGGQQDALAALTANDPTTLDMDMEPEFLGHSTKGISHPSENAMPTEALRRPQRLTDKRKTRASRMDISSHVRASAFFDMPSERPEVTMQGNSAMATLDSILDASAEAPVSAFTDHAFAGKLGNEVYGKEKFRKSQAPAATLRPVASEHQLKKKTSSFMWLGKKSSTNFDSSKTKSMSSYSALDNDDEDDRRSRSSRSDVDDAESFVYRVPAGVPHPEEDEHKVDGEEESDDEEGVYHGAPTTLLAELQLRKQQQQNRTQHLTKAFPQGMHATLLEMDAVAEAQRKERKDKRVNLAWEEPNAHIDQNGSDDEDVPLALIAAKNAGAKNMADMERPIGLMERREIEDNEPLSRRRARLQGGPAASEMILKAQSVADLATTRMAGVHHSPAASRDLMTPDLTYEPDDDDEEETLAERRKRLAAEEEAEGKLPRTRPVSRAFSEELLSEFGPPSESKLETLSVNREATKTPLDVGGGDETLGQRRKRLQAEREARAREMSYGALNGDGGSAPARSATLGSMTRRLSMADVLSAHPKKDSTDLRHEEVRKRLEEESRAREMEAKMAQMRMGMPQTVSGMSGPRNGGFPGGMYNNGQQRPIAHHASRASLGGGYAMSGNVMMNNGFHNAQAGYGMPNMGIRPATQGANMVNMSHQRGMPQFSMQMQQMQQMQMQMGMAMGVDMSRVEKWRQGVGQ